MAMELNIPIIQVVGYQSSGKTTVVEKIIASFAHTGRQVGTIKHHGHGGEPASIDDGKDSFRHRQAGAVATAVEGGGVMQLQASKEKWELTDILTIYSQIDLSLIIIEGYKAAPYQKIVMIREKKDLDLLTTLVNIKAVITWIPLEVEITEKYKLFSINEEEQLIEWLNHVVRDFNE
jgi:molybdopterin-guanine dinucleotide biosynthesis adapter protein